MTFWILLTIAAFLTIVAIRRYNLLFSASASLSWFALWGYNLNYPPTNVTVGSFVYDLMYYAFILMAIAVIFIYFAGRTKKESITTLGVEDGKIVALSSSRENVPDNNAEYRQRVRAALRSNRRRR